jgi:hypothetical protein
MKRGWPPGVISFQNIGRKSRLTTFPDAQFFMMLKSTVMIFVSVE